MNKATNFYLKIATLFVNLPKFLFLDAIKPSFFSHRKNFKLLGSSKMTTAEEGLAKRLWVRYNKEAIGSLYTPFVVSLASGNLKLHTFRQYIAQDVHFLKVFAQSYELAEECTDDDDAKVSIAELRQSVLDELKMHSSFCQEWGFDMSTETLPNSATLNYTNFLLATASGSGKEKTKVAAYTIAAMVPCMRLYAFLGTELQSLVDINHPYFKWIHTYSSQPFQAAALQTEELLNKLSVSLVGQELEILQKLYNQALKLETEFFLAQPIDQPTIVPLSKYHNHGLVIFSDFDLTCTVVDSCSILAEIALKSDQIQPETHLIDSRNIWAALSSQYTEEYEKFMECILVDREVNDFDYKGLRKALEQLSEFERKANTRVIESNILKGLNLEDIKRAGERLDLQDGCVDFFRCITKKENLNAKVHVLSYCWCGDLIRSAFSSEGIHDLHLHANELIYEGVVSTGEIKRNVETPMDKLEAFMEIVKEDKVSIYIGDSVGDLLCLLQADIGIVVGSSSSLRRVGRHFGVSLVPLFAGLVMKHGKGRFFIRKGVSGIVYTVSSWAEIHSFVIGS